MMNFICLAAALAVGFAVIGCSDKTTTEKKTEVTTNGPRRGN
jgi:hypothetical protein